MICETCKKEVGRKYSYIDAEVYSIIICFSCIEKLEFKRTTHSDK